MKRIFDVCISLILLVLFAPIFFIVSALIKIDSQGPVLFKQVRVGRNGKAFDIYKFRSMRSEAESTGPHYTSQNDNRITPIGKIIRKSSLDEIPQLYNVLVGDMSLVGPRPNVPLQREEYTESEWCKRNSVRPGITGLAQATLRSSATKQQRTNLDLEYVEKASFFYDMNILCLTVKQVVSRGGN